LERPQCAALIAAIASEWTRVEEKFAELIGAATGVSKPVYLEGMQTCNWTNEPNMIVQATFRAAESVHAKLNAFEYAWQAVGFPEHLRVMRAEIFKCVRSCAKERNQIVHAVWCVVADYPDDLLRKGAAGEPFMRYTRDDLRQILQRLLNLQDRVFELYIQCTGNQAGMALPAPLAFI
jgi:hypothetical protein